MAHPISGHKHKPKEAGVVKSDQMSSEDQIQKTKTDFMKIITATLRYQNPEKPADPGQIAQTMASIQQTEETVRMRSSMEKLELTLKDSKFSRALPMQGKIVRVDTGAKKFSGTGTVDFAYQLKFDDSRKPPASTISTIISVYNSKGVKVFQTKGNNSKGSHSFKWDGRNERGELQKEDEYSIRVESFFAVEDQEGKIVKFPVEAGSFIEGRVESLDMKDGKVQLFVGGGYYDLEDVIKVVSEAEKKEVAKISDYAGYIGQVAEIEDDIINISDKGFAKLNYNCEIERPAKTSIHLFEDDRLVGVAVIDGVKKGVNKLSFKVSDAMTESEAEKFNSGSEEFNELGVGKYKYKIFQQNLLDTDPDKFSEVSRSKTITITGLDFSKEPLVVAGSEKFSISTIRKLSSPSSHEMMIESSLKYIGKTAKVDFASFEVKAGKTFEAQYVMVTAPEAGSHYGDAYMNVYDKDGKQVARVKTNTLFQAKDSQIFYKDTLWDFLRDEDINEIFDNRAMAAASKDFATVKKYYEEVVNPDRGRDVFPELVDDIYKEWQKGIVIIDEAKVAKYFGYEYDKLSESDKMLVRAAMQSNKPVTGFYWDLKDSDGKSVYPGTYKYEFQIEKYHTPRTGGTPVLEIEKIDDFASIKITEYRTENGQTKYFGYLLGEDGNPISDKLTSFSLDEIISISA
jgi:flagellar hook assembly protein FlgD